MPRVSPSLNLCRSSLAYSDGTALLSRRIRFAYAGSLDVWQFPKGHPAVARLMFRLVEELRKVGREVDARYIEKDMFKMAQRFEETPTDTVFEQDIEFLSKLTNQPQDSLKLDISPSRVGGDSQKNERYTSRLKPTRVRPKLSWVD